MQKLKDRVAIITGAGSGIGRATALLFAREGANVVVVSRSDRAGPVAQEICRGGGNAAFVRCDISDGAQIEAMVHACVERYGRLDILVNNAARNRPNPPVAELVADLDETEWTATLQTNLTGYFLCSKFALRQMLPKRSGVIVNVASSAGVQGTPKLAAYSASKAGVIALTKCMALDYAAKGIRVNAILPLIHTERMDTIWQGDPTQRSATELAIPMGRMGTPEEAATTILFLASDDSSYMTGALLALDGGRVALR